MRGMVSEEHDDTKKVNQVLSETERFSEEKDQASVEDRFPLRITETSFSPT